ncbi:MAG: hypothetical protein K5859_07615 [Atopobiaceae bacterium]|nr:hypothetical protein [Atopobiaceae bacterium]
MIDFEKIFEEVPSEKLEEIGQALLDGATADKVKAMFAEDGFDLSLEDINKVSAGVIAKLQKRDEEVRELADDELEQVAGGCSDDNTSCSE